MDTRLKSPTQEISDDGVNFSSIRNKQNTYCVYAIYQEF
jgi:hypothetical protein